MSAIGRWLGRRAVIGKLAIVLSAVAVVACLGDATGSSGLPTATPICAAPGVAVEVITQLEVTLSASDAGRFDDALAASSAAGDAATRLHELALEAKKAGAPVEWVGTLDALSILGDQVAFLFEDVQDVGGRPSPESLDGIRRAVSQSRAGIGMLRDQMTAAGLATCWPAFGSIHSTAPTRYRSTLSKSGNDQAGSSQRRNTVGGPRSEARRSVGLSQPKMRTALRV